MPQPISRRDFLRQSLQGAAVFYGWNLIDLMANAIRARDAESMAEGKLLWVETAGSAYEIGRQYGEKLGEVFVSHAKTEVERLRKRFEPEPMEKVCQLMLDVLRHDFPYLVEEMHGMAEGARLEFTEVALANLSAGFGGLINDKEGCTNIIFIRSECGPIMGKTLDGSDHKVSTGVVRLIRPQVGHALLCFTRLAGLSTEQGINDKGLGVGEASLHFPTINPKGIIRNHLPRLLLQECANVEEGIQFLSRYPVLRHGFHFALADKAGHAAIVERSPTEMYVRRIEEKTIFCTNHAATPCMRKLELSRGPVGDRNSDERYANLQRITSSPDFEMTLESMKNILRNHRVPGGICQHGDLEMCTQRAYIVIVNEGKLLVTNGPACRHEFQEFGLQAKG